MLGTCANNFRLSTGECFRGSHRSHSYERAHMQWRNGGAYDFSDWMAFLRRCDRDIGDHPVTRGRTRSSQVGRLLTCIAGKWYVLIARATRHRPREAAGRTSFLLRISLPSSVVFPWPSRPSNRRLRPHPSAGGNECSRSAAKYRRVGPRVGSAGCRISPRKRNETVLECNFAFAGTFLPLNLELGRMRVPSTNSARLCISGDAALP